MRNPPIRNNVAPHNASSIRSPAGKKPAESVNTTSTQGLARKTSAGAVDSLSGNRNMVATSKAQEKLSSVNLSEIKQTSLAEGSLLEKKVFDHNSIELTNRAYKAVSQAYDDVQTYFFKPRAPDIHSRIQPIHHEKFREARTAAQKYAKNDKNKSDLPSDNAYFSLSQLRKNIVGNSPLENYIPKDSRFRNLLEPGTGGIRDIKTGLHAMLSHDSKTGTYTLAFPGTGAADTSGVQWATNIKQFMGIGGVPAAYRDAVELVRELQEKLPAGSKLELSGHSLGGGIATYAGLMQSVDTVGFNSAALGPACMKSLKKANALNTENLNRVKQVRFKGDPVSSPKLQLALTSLLNFGWLLPNRVPRLLGVVHEISSDSKLRPDSAVERHMIEGFGNYYLGS